MNVASVHSEGVVTHEAVVLQFETAGIGSRLLAQALDLLVQWSCLLALTFGAAVWSGGGLGMLAPGWATAVFLLLIFLVLFGYPVAMETLWRGRTLGKAALGLRVVTVEGAPVRFRHAAVRAALATVDFYLSSGAVAVLAVLFSPRNQRLGDMVAGTLVLRERTGARMPASVTFPVPPGAEAYVASLDVAGLTPTEYGAIRSLLLRGPALAPSVRAALAAQLAPPIADRLRHSPPPGTPPELFLACVAAAYQRRQGRGVAGLG